MLDYLKQIWNSKDLRKRILFTIAILLGYRFIAQITVPGIDLELFQNAQEGQNQLLQVFSLLTGGNTESFSIVLMGISPYINASIIIQLLTVVIPKLESLSKEGEQGRRVINSYTRWLTIPLALLQSYGMIIFINSQLQAPLIDSGNPAIVLPIMLTISAGTMFLVWLGDMITENGIGNGISLIIFASILSQIPAIVGQGLFTATVDQSTLIPFIVMILVTLILFTIVVIVTEAQRNIPLTYSGKSIKRQQDASLPIKINQAGMIPIIFAFAMISLPSVLGQFLTSAKSASLRNFGEALYTAFLPDSLSYLIIYFLLVFGFTFFYVSITFNAKNIAESIQKRGAYIAGVRPGTQTVEYIDKVSKRLTFFGATFLASIAVSPLILDSFFSNNVGNIPLILTGASIIIIVGVILELIRQIDSHLVMQDYSKFYK